MKCEPDRCKYKDPQGHFARCALVPKPRGRINPASIAEKVPFVELTEPYAAQASDCELANKVLVLQNLARIRQVNRAFIAEPHFLQNDLLLEVLVNLIAK